ncbi:hypothetical protein MSAN_02159900 [Mycena sanguinolenta]|uniref:Uncharacterized protein n=1 Tax=Mycena sanguinolenta TaxID=230812 RepID=A0A8H6XF89_9AGAR|nr:hypothetical protein MSAN_02159900 [Mycena sanguinolenta]
MGRKTKDLPDFIEEHPETKHIRCRICQENDPMNFGKWILRHSLIGHLQSDVHSAQVLRQAARRQEEEENARRPRSVYSGPEASLAESPNTVSHSQYPAMFDAEDGYSHSPTYADFEAAGLDVPIVPTYMPLYDPNDEQTRLKVEVEKMLSQSDQNADDNDIALPDTTSLQDIENEEDELDDDLAYTQVPLESAYSPHPNKVDFANPEVSKHLQFYPEETTGPVSEVWQAERWKEFKPSELTPMYACGPRQFYIDEVAILKNGWLVIPTAWIKREGALCADCVQVMPAEGGWVIGTQVYSFAASQFAYNYHDVVESVGGEIKWAESIEAPKMPNPLRELAQGDDLYVVMVPIWADDVSGNKSKQYNKHINMYLANSNLPGQLLQQEYFVRFVSTSPHATSPEQFSALKEQIQATHSNPIPCYNAETHRNCRIILRVPSLPADNPQQSEEASHMGGNANCGCRRCKAGGTHEVTESDAGYHNMHYAGIPRLAAETKKTLEDQIDLAMYGVEAPITRLQTATGVKDKVAQYWIDILLKKSREIKANNPGRTAESIKRELEIWLSQQPGDKVNPLLDISGLDPNHDTPVEILHTILLGIIKYVWYMLHSGWTDDQRNLFVVRLQSTDIDGLTIPPIRAAYMMQYRNGLIGKHFKTLMQTMIFHVHDLVSPELFALVKAVSHLGTVLWVHEIDDMAQYTSDLSTLIGNVLDAFGDQDSAKILLKIKLHLLPHIVEDVRRFGPPIRNSTEVFECFNAIFCLCSILSNHQAPSRDIAMKFASMDRLKHILSGGFWKVDNDWVCAGPNVLAVLKNMPIIQRHLGWVPPRTVITGRIQELLLPESRAEGVPNGVVTLERFLVSETLHPDFGMPVLQKPADTTLQTVVVLANAVMFRFSAAHDCRLVKCDPTALRPVRQERQETSQTIKILAHRDDEHFVINMAALHNATLLRRNLPVALTVPRPLYVDREAHHHLVAIHLRTSQTAKRARTQEKRRATLKAKRDAQADLDTSDEEESDEDDEDVESEAPKRKRTRQ